MARRTAVEPAVKRERPSAIAPQKPATAKAVSPAKAKSRRDVAELTPELQIKALRTECENLRRELAAAQARIEALEERRAELAERIAWTLDTLQDLLEDD